MASEFPELKNNKLSIILTDNEIEQAQDTGNPNPNKIIIPSNVWDDIYQSTLPNQPWWDEVEIDVEGINNTDIGILTANLENNGYYEYIYNEQEGKDELTLIENYQEGQDYDVWVNVQPELQSKTCNVTNNSPATQTIIPDQGKYGLSSVTVNNQVIIPDVPTLETLTNKRLQSEQTYTISSLMTDSTNNAGITKESTLIVDLPDYPPTSGQLTLDLTSNTSGTGFTTIYPLSQINKDYFSSVRYRVKSKIELKGIKTYDFSSISVDFSSFNIQSTTGTISVPSYNLLIRINNESSYYTINFIYNHSTSAINTDIYANNYYYIVNTTYNYIYIVDNNNSSVLLLYDYNEDDDKISRVRLYKSFFNISAFN